MTTGDFIVARLMEWGVARIYGYSGDRINGLIGAIERTEGKLAFVQVRHEEMAAFMATAHAKYTGEVGVALATSGPGAIHLLNGLYDAQTDHVPVVAIVGQAAEDVAAAWQTAFAADRPIVVEAVTDPNVATLPPFITVEQAKHFASAFLKGDPDAPGAIVQSVKGLLAQVVPKEP